MVSPELLRRYPIFGGLSEAQFKAIAMIAEQERYETDEFIFEEREPAEALYIITAGEVAILVNVDDKGEEKEELARLPAGSVLGWSALVPPHTLTASGVANAPTELITIDAEALRQQFAADYALGYQILSKVAGVMRERMSKTRIQLASVSGC